MTAALRDQQQGLATLNECQSVGDYLRVRQSAEHVEMGEAWMENNLVFPVLPHMQQQAADTMDRMLRGADSIGVKLGVKLQRAARDQMIELEPATINSVPARLLFSPRAWW